jgi:hypothetical protein
MTDGHIHLESLDHKILQWILQKATGAKDTQVKLDLSEPFSQETKEETIAKSIVPLRLINVFQEMGPNIALEW